MIFPKCASTYGPFLDKVLLLIGAILCIAVLNFITIDLLGCFCPDVILYITLIKFK